MKYALLVLLIIGTHTAFSQAEKPEQRLARLEQDRLNYILTRDSVKLASMYDDKYNGVLANGKEVTKAGVLEYQLATNPHLKVSIEEVKAFIYGDVGITKGVQVNRSKAGTILGQSRFVRVYQKNGAGWKIVYSQGTISQLD